MTKQSGLYGSTSGEKGKLRLTTVQILGVVRKLDEFGMLDCLQWLHFHFGSQIPSTEILTEGISQGAHIYTELVRLGAFMKVIDIGGCLGIDYDGSKSFNWDMSVSYTLDEYACAVVKAVQVVCDRKGVEHAILCSESGRSFLSHHSILVFNAVSSSTTTTTASFPIGSEYLVEGLTGEARELYDGIHTSVKREEYDDCLVYADQLKQCCIQQFKDGCLGMESLQ